MKRDQFGRSQDLTATQPISHDVLKEKYPKPGIVEALRKAAETMRRGAQMGVLRIDHPDLHAFSTAKRTPGRWNNFNVSVGMPDAFMHALAQDQSWELVHKAKPGILFMDHINQHNNLRYCDEIAGTNPCVTADHRVRRVTCRTRYTREAGWAEAAQRNVCG